MKVAIKQIDIFCIIFKKKKIFPNLSCKILRLVTQDNGIFRNDKRNIIQCSRIQYLEIS